jgi:cell wall-associated NlpC family hydrolase
MTRYRRRRPHFVGRHMTRRERRNLAIAGAVVAVVAMAAGGHAVAHGSSSSSGTGPPTRAAAQAIAFAEHQEGCPYIYGGTGPCDDGWDCSGLVQAAYASAGITIARTSEEQWSTEEHVSTPEPGDLVFFTGDPIDPPPGHVAIYVGPNQIIDAYETGEPVQQQSFGLPSSAGGLTTVYGYTNPLEGS